VLHVMMDTLPFSGRSVTVGHGVILHGCTASIARPIGMGRCSERRENRHRLDLLPRDAGS